MAKLTPFPDAQVFDDNGDPLSGGFVYTYEAGTTTPKATYTDTGEGTANANPVVLDSEGRGEIWLGDGAYYLVVRDSLGNLVDERDDVVGDTSGSFLGTTFDVSANTTINAAYQNSLITTTSSPTLALIDVATAGAGFAFTVNNEGAGTVTVDPDSTETINGSSTLTLSSGDWAIIVCDGTEWKATVGQSILTKNNTFSGANTFTGVNTFTKTQKWAKGADVASATALTLGTDGNYFDVTGTTTITSIATVGVGTVIKLQFDGILTLTHHATDLILPGAANITTAAGDEAEFVEYASGDWRCTSYQRAASFPATQSYVTTAISGIVTKTSASATTSGTAVDFTGLPSGLSNIEVVLNGCSLSGTDNFLIQLIVSGSPVTTGYNSYTSTPLSGGSATSTAGFIVRSASAANTVNGVVRLKIDTTTSTVWADGIPAGVGIGSTIDCSGVKTFSGTITGIRLTRTGTDTLDLGAAYLNYWS